MPGASHRPVIALLLTVVLVAGCGSSGPSPSPAASTAPLPAPTSSSGVPGSTAGPALPPSPTPEPADPFLGQVVTTVSDNLRVRSEPRVADDSIKYEPLLPLGTELTVLDGPVSGSGYTWYKVEPVSFTGLEGPGQGWVAMAAKDGEPWIALADAPIAGIELAKADVARAHGRPRRREDRRRLDQRLRARPPAGHARGRDARARRERGLLPDEHRPRPRDGPGRCQGRDRQPRWTPSSTRPAGTRWVPGSTRSSRPSPRATRPGRRVRRGADPRAGIADRQRRLRPA